MTARNRANASGRVPDPQALTLGHYPGSLPTATGMNRMRRHVSADGAGTRLYERKYFSIRSIALSSVSSFLQKEKRMKWRGAWCW